LVHARGIQRRTCSGGPPTRIRPTDCRCSSACDAGRFAHNILHAEHLQVGAHNTWTDHTAYLLLRTATAADTCPRLGSTIFDNAFLTHPTPARRRVHSTYYCYANSRTGQPTTASHIYDLCHPVNSKSQEFTDFWGMHLDQNRLASSRRCGRLRKTAVDQHKFRVIN